MEMYQELHKWDEAIVVAEAKVISCYQLFYGILYKVDVDQNILYPLNPLKYNEVATVQCRSSVVI